MRCTKNLFKQKPMISSKLKTGYCLTSPILNKHLNFWQKKMVNNWPFLYTILQKYSVTLPSIKKQNYMTCFSYLKNIIKKIKKTCSLYISQYLYTIQRNKHTKIWISYILYNPTTNKRSKELYEKQQIDKTWWP